MSARTPVVIAGAGPCGLMLACELRLRGVAVRLLEAEAEPGRGSRAIQLWPPALRIFGEVGILTEALRRGQRVRENQYHLAGGRTLTVELGAENEPLLLPQEQTCELLTGALIRLGGRIERSVRVTDLTETGETVLVKADGPGGPEQIEADWFVAADGVRSTARELLGIDFPGERIQSTLLLAEGKIDGPCRPGAVHYFLGRTGSMVFAPMRADYTRVSAAIPADLPLTAESVQRLLDERGPGGLRVADLRVLTTFSSSERIASALRKGRCFLVGDAGHTHSPLGGQGLNLGLQDVHNLAWKLAGVVTGEYAPAIMDSYAAERRHAAEQVVGTTRAMLRMFTVGPMAARMRNAAWRALDRGGVLRRWFVPLLAGSRLRYPRDLFGRPVGRAGWRDLPARLRAARSPRPGALAPRWALNRQGGELIRFALLTTGRPSAALVARARTLAASRPDVLAHRHVPRGRPSYLLIRPDGYVAAGGRTLGELEYAIGRLESLC